MKNILPKLSKIKGLLLLCSILRNKQMMKMLFCMQVIMKNYCKLIQRFWWRWLKHFESSQNSKLAVSLQYFKKQVRCEVYFLHADQDQSGLEFDLNTLNTKVFYSVILSLLTSITKHSQSTQIFAGSQKKFRTGLHFLHAEDKHQSF